MTREQLGCEIRYRTALCLAKQMLLQEIISEKDFQKIRSTLLKRYQPVFGTILA